MTMTRGSSPKSETVCSASRTSRHSGAATGTVRIASYLLHKAPADEDAFELDIAKSVIASRLSVKPETFSRILKQLHDKDIVVIEGRRVTIRDREAMIRLCYG